MSKNVKNSNGKAAATTSKKSSRKAANGKATAAKKVATKAKAVSSGQILLQNVNVKYINGNGKADKSILTNADFVKQCDAIIYDYATAAMAKNRKNAAKVNELLQLLAALDTATNTTKKAIYADAVLDSTAKVLKYDRKAKEYNQLDIAIYKARFVKLVQNRVVFITNRNNSKGTTKKDLI